MTREEAIAELHAIRIELDALQAMKAQLREMGRLLSIISNELAPYQTERAPSELDNLVDMQAYRLSVTEKSL